MIKKTSGKAAQCFVKFKIRSVVILFCLISIIAGVSGIAIQNSDAFWTYNKLGDNPQHMRITQLIRYPQNELFSKYWRKMGKWSEEPDAGKDSIFGHGNEEFRGKQSLDAALDHYRKYLENPKRSGELEIAAQCLAHAYHYFEDVGDFSEGNIPLRKSVSAELDYLHKNYTWARIQIDDRKRNIQPNRDKIIDVLKRLKRQKISNQNSDQIRNALLLIIASLEQMNIFFLDAVNQQPQPQPQAKPQPPTDNRKWIVWHGCAGPSFACVIELSRTTEIELRQSGRKVTIMGTYNTEQEARQATCAKFTGIRAGGQFAAGTLGNIGKDVYCVKNFFYYDSRENRYKCR